MTPKPAPKQHPSRARSPRAAAPGPLGSGRTAFAISSLLLALSSACSREDKALGAPPPPVPVRVAVAEIATVPIEMRAIGTVEPLATVSLKPRVTGMITEVRFEEGQDVREGDVLFTLDRRPFEVALREAEANLAQARSQASNAAAEARRYAELAQAGVGTRQEAEQRKAAAVTAAAAVQAQAAAVAARRLDLEYTSIKAPISGRTGAVRVRQGNLVQANQTELLVINQIQPISVSFTAVERDLRALQQYMQRGDLPVMAAPPDEPDLVEEGTVTFVDNAVERNTGTVRVKGTFPNEELLLWPGQFVEAVVTLETRPDVLVVPAAAVQTGQGGTFVFVIDPSMTAQMRAVRVGERVEGNRVIVAEGVGAGERVVTDGHIRLTPGAKVNIVDEAQDQAPAGPAQPAGSKEGR